MKLLVLGGTGRTGVHLLQQASERGHEVTALARDPAKLGSADPRIKPVQGDVMKPDTLRAALAGHDAVLATLTSGTRSYGPVSFFDDSVGNIVAAMRETGVKRLVYVTSGGVEAKDPVHGLLMKLVVHPMLRHVYADMARAEQRLMAADVDWTIVRPPYLSDGALTGRYRISERFAPPKGTKLSRADLAHFMLAALDPKYVKRIPSIAY
jgi:uncharacterized protein YbjT (DUF2867 family)